MSRTFNAYAEYYDLLYRDKDYASESGYVWRLLNEHGVRSGALLDLGCGTGKHARLLAEHGLHVTGLDISQQMIDVARDSVSGSQSAQLDFRVGDVRSFRLDRKFDAVVSLFHVASYQVENRDLMEMFQSVAGHLTPDGVFIFDFWYGPAVLSDPPAVRVRRLESDRADVIRLAQPQLHANDNVVDVNYEVLVIDRISHVTETIREQHRMRYLFLPELRAYLASAGLEVVFAQRWLGGPLGLDSWNGVVVARLGRA